MAPAERGVLFLCTGNSARSVLAEMYVNHTGKGRFRAYSAGSFPKGEVHPMTLATLRAAGIRTDGARSKSWDEFARSSAPAIDLVITVCDNAAAEVCPVWPGTPAKAHWSFPDPAAIEGDERTKRAAFETVFAAIRKAIDGMLALPDVAFDGPGAGAQLSAIGPN